MKIDWIMWQTEQYQRKRDGREIFILEDRR